MIGTHISNSQLQNTLPHWIDIRHQVQCPSPESRSNKLLTTFAGGAAASLFCFFFAGVFFFLGVYFFFDAFFFTFDGPATSVSSILFLYKFFGK